MDGREWEPSVHCTSPGATAGDGTPNAATVVAAEAADEAAARNTTGTRFN